MASPTNSSKKTPLIAAGAVVVVGIAIYAMTRGGGAPAGKNLGRSEKPAAPPQGKAAKMSVNTEKSLVLTAPRQIKKLPANNELGTGKEAWVAEIQYVWKDETDDKMQFRAPYKDPSERGSFAIPAKGTAGTIKTTGKTPEDTTFLLPQQKGTLRLLIPSTPAMKLKKGDKISVSLQADINKWRIPASNSIVLPPLT